MDTFFERLIVKKKRPEDYLIMFGSIPAAIIGLFISHTIPVLTYFSIFIDVCLAYGVYYAFTSRNIEYEYIYTNGDLDVDMVISKRRRKRLFSTNCKNFDIVERPNTDRYKDEEKNAKKRMEFVSSMSSPNVYYAALNNKGVRTVIFLEIDQRLQNALKAYIPKKIIIS